MTYHTHTQDSDLILDDLDKRLLNLLQTDATLTFKEIADEVHSSSATCQRRVKQLTEAGVISKQVALVDPQAVGRQISAFVWVKMEKASIAAQDEFERLVRRESDIAGCYEISGDYDFILLAHCRDMPSYHKLTRRLLIYENNVRSYHSQFVMNFSKVETKIDI